MAHDGGTPPLLVLGKISTILGCFSLERPELTLRDITARSGVPASTAQRLVRNLVREGFLDRTGDRYRIGLQLVRWAAPGTLGLDLVTRTRDALTELRERTGETSCLYVRDGGQRTVLATVPGAHAVRRVFRVGMVMPLHAGAPGKVLLAFDPDARRDALDAGLARYASNTPVAVDTLDAQVARTREQGYAVALDERDDGVGSIAAPVFDHAGTLVATIGIAAPTPRLGAAEIERMVPEVVAAGQRASAALGHRLPS